MHGWALSPELTLIGVNKSIEILDRFERPDVPEHKPFDKYGFHCNASWDGESLRLSGNGDQTFLVPLPQPRIWHKALSDLRSVGQLAGIVVRNLPDVFAAALNKDEKAQARVVSQLSGSNQPHVSVPEIALSAFPDEIGHSRAATIIVPIYNAFDMLPEMLTRVAEHTDVAGRLILVEDCSTDERVRPFLQEWVKGPQAQGMPLTVELLENVENLGFIKSVNRAFLRALDFDDPVILLNSDAMVPEGWSSRLLAPLQRDPSVASVTPMSNDAEIFSVPKICEKRDLVDGQVDAIDRAASRLGSDVIVPTTPTGVGFCMAMSPRYLRAEPVFDTAFGKGYGEEVDWCQKLRASGARHVAAGNLFVEHRGGASFGSEAKKALVARNNAVVSERYPTYDAEVQEFIRRDPLAVPRFAAGIAWALSLRDDPLPIYVAHAMGGGAESYLKRRIEGDLEHYGAAVVLRLGSAPRWHLELHHGGGVERACAVREEVLAKLFAAEGSRQLVYSCAVGDTDPLNLPAVLVSLVDPDRDSIEVLFHDFFPVSPAYTLLGSDGTYAGVPPATTTDPAHLHLQADGTPVPLSAWRHAWGTLLEAAASLVVFSRSSQQIVAEAYPDLAGKIQLLPHQDSVTLPRLTPPAVTGPSIGVLGDIGYQKGAEVLARLGDPLARSDARLTIIGRVDPAYQPPASVTVHGGYDLEDLPQLVSQYGIDRWFIPSIWPETFSYTTREALSTGLPVYCFDLGGQAEGARAAPNGHVLPLALAQDERALAAALVCSEERQEIQHLDSAQIRM